MQPSADPGLKPSPWSVEPVRGTRPWWHVPVPAAVGAIAVAALTLTPSLIPHAAVIQGVVTGLGAACGYAVGLGVSRAVRTVTIRNEPPSYGSPTSWAWILLVGGAGLAAMMVLGKVWADEVSVTMGAPIPDDGPWWVITATVALIITVLLVGIGRAIRRLSRRVARFADRPGMPDAVAPTIGVLSAGLVTLTVLGALLGIGYTAIDRVFQDVNDTTTEGVTQPTVPTVSGAPASVVSWDDLGADGRDFISAVPTTERISAFTGAAALDPVRVFVGVDSSPDPVDRADLAVADLEALGGFDRAVLVVVTSTGTGWVDQSAIEPLELMHGGDTAVVATQYSTLPSWLSFLVDQQRAREAGAALFEAVHARWSALPADQRPLLLVYGESLGALGAEAAFDSVADMAARTQGMLLVGPPSVSPVHQTVTEGRDPGTPAWQPVYDGGVTLRFGSRADDLSQPAGPWTAPRLAYLQNASDPVVWWSPTLIWSRPDWLAEPPGPDVSAHARWWPLVTFLQVTGDMMDSTSVPAGHGHVYGPNQAGAWAQIAPPAGWTAADTARLTAEFA